MVVRNLEDLKVVYIPEVLRRGSSSDSLLDNAYLVTAISDFLELGLWLG